MNLKDLQEEYRRTTEEKDELYNKLAKISTQPHPTMTGINVQLLFLATLNVEPLCPKERLVSS